jgi:hypothetical protein
LAGEVSQLRRVRLNMIFMLARAVKSGHLLNPGGSAREGTTGALEGEAGTEGGISTIRRHGLWVATGVSALSTCTVMVPSPSLAFSVLRNVLGITGDAGGRVAIENAFASENPVEDDWRGMGRKEAFEELRPT